MEFLRGVPNVEDVDLSTLTEPGAAINTVPTLAWSDDAGWFRGLQIAWGNVEPADKGYKRYTSTRARGVGKPPRTRRLTRTTTIGVITALAAVTRQRRAKANSTDGRRLALTMGERLGASTTARSGRAATRTKANACAAFATAALERRRLGTRASLRPRRANAVDGAARDRGVNAAHVAKAC